MMGGIGAFVWCGRRKLYRLFPDTSIHPLGRHGCNDMFVWDNRSDPIVEKRMYIWKNEMSDYEWRAPISLQSIRPLSK